MFNESRCIQDRKVLLPQRLLLKSPVKHLCLFQSFFLMMTLFFVFLSGIFKRRHKAGLVSAMIDALQHYLESALQDPISLQFPCFTFWFGCHAPIVCVHKESDWLGTTCRVDHNAHNTSKPSSGFRGFLLFQSPLRQISPRKVSLCALQDSRVLLQVPIALIGVHKVGRYCIERRVILFRRHRWLNLKACTII